MTVQEMSREDQKAIRIDLIAGIREKESLLRTLGFDTGEVDA